MEQTEEGRTAKGEEGRTRRMEQTEEGRTAKGEEARTRRMEQTEEGRTAKGEEARTRRMEQTEEGRTAKGEEGRTRRMEQTEEGRTAKGEEARTRRMEQTEEGRTAKGEEARTRRMEQTEEGRTAKGEEARTRRMEQTEEGRTEKRTGERRTLPIPKHVKVVPYKKKPGFADASGSEFEWKMCSLLLLRLLRLECPFFLGSNMRECDGFDDIVLLYGVQGSMTALCMQLKHMLERAVVIREDRLLNASGKLSLPKLCRSFKKMDAEFRHAMERALHVLITDCEYILFTNTVVLCASRGSNRDCLLNTGGKVFSLSAEEDARLLDVYQKLLDNEGVDQAQANTKVFPLESLEDFRRFLVRLRIFHQQSDVADLDGLVRAEFDALWGWQRQEGGHPYKSFMEKVHQWWKTASYYLTEDAVLLQEVFVDVVARLSCRKLAQLRSLAVKFAGPSLHALRRLLSSSQRVIIIISKCCDACLTVLKVHQALEGECHVLVGKDAFREHLATLLKVWRCRWRPVLVVEDAVEARELAKEGHRLVLVVTTSAHTLAGVTDDELVLSDDCRFRDLDAQSQEQILDQHVLFQGHSVRLRELVRANAGMLAEIRNDVLVELVKWHGHVTVGTCPFDPVVNYIPRTLYRSSSVSQTLFKVRDSVFVLSGPSLDAVNAATGQQACAYRSEDTRVCVACECPYLFVEHASAGAHFESICGHESVRDVHWIRVDRGRLQWVASKGDVQVITAHLDKSVTQRYDPEDADDVADRTVIVVAEAGMGKTTLINWLAHCTKERNTHTWVIRMNLNDHTVQLRDLRVTDKEEVFHILRTAAFGSQGSASPFAEAFFTHCLSRSGNVVVLVDAFDEICSRYVHEGIHLLTCLLETAAKRVWVASRAVTRPHLEAALSSLSFSICAFDERDQREFLEKFWSRTLADTRHVHAFIDRVLSVMKESLGRHGSKLMGIPLLTMMVAEYFENDIKGHVNGSDKLLTNQGTLNIIELYERFVEKKYRIVLGEKSGGDDSKAMYESYVALFSDLHNEHHMKLSLVALLPADKHHLVRPRPVMSDALALLEKEHDIEKAGIVIKIDLGIPYFLHRTFAEYFMALWLTKHYTHNGRLLVETLFDANFNIMRKMFDGILTRHHALHGAVLNCDIQQLRRLLAADAAVDARDRGGRTPLHLAVSYKEMHETLGVVNILLARGGDVTARDHVLQWTPLQYAEYVEAWAAVEALLQAGAAEDQLTNTRLRIEDTSYLKSVLMVSAQNGYAAILRFLIRNGANVNMVVGNNHYTSLHLASQYGRTNVVQCLLQARADLNVSNIDAATPLHLAVGWGHSSTVRCLVDAGADVERSDIAGNSALDIATRWNYEDIVSFLVQAGAHSAICDYSNSPALHKAVREADVASLQRLLHHAEDDDVNMADSEGATALHCAAESGHKETASMLQLLLQAGAAINAADHKGRTALYHAAGWDHRDAVRCLLVHGADVDLADTAGSTPLHQASRWGHTTSVRYLLAAGARPNQQDAEKYAPLHWAAMRGYTNTVVCLVEGKALINMSGAEGASALHLAVAEGHLAIVRYLIQAGADVHMTDSAGCTPLSLAARLGHISIERYLRSVGVVV